MSLTPAAELASSPAGVDRYRRPPYALGIIGRSMARELFSFTLLGIVALSLPVVLVSLDAHLPSFALSLDRFWRMVYAIACMILVHTIPVVSAAVIVWVYARFLSEGVIVILFAAGRSTLACVFPAMTVAAFAVLLGFLMSTVVAPSNARYIHDTLLFLRRDMNLGILEPGAFHYFKNERTTIFFARKTGKTHFSDIFIAKELEDDPRSQNREEVYFARNAHMIGRDGDRALLMLDGGATIIKKETDDQKTIRFERSIWRPESGFAEPERGYVFYDELDTSAFLKSRIGASGADAPRGQWLREAIKRFAFPLLTVVHALFGLGVLMVMAPAMGRSNRPYILASLLSAFTFAAHILYVYLVELISNVGMVGVVVFVAGVTAQATIGALLLLQAQNPRLRGAAMALNSGLMALEAMAEKFQARLIRKRNGPAAGEADA